MSEVQDTERSAIDKLLDNAESVAEDTVTYITQTRLHIGANEATLDLYYTSPSLDGSAGETVSLHTHRLVLPLGLAKDLARSLHEGTKAWEQQMGIELPFTPAEIESDDSDASD